MKCSAMVTSFCDLETGVVDNILSRKFKEGHLVRLAVGVYVKAGVRRPETDEIAQFKANRFGKQIIAKGGAEHGKAIYVTNGPSSSFRYGSQLIEFRRATSRKRLAAEARWHPHTTAIASSGESPGIAGGIGELVALLRLLSELLSAIIEVLALQPSGATRLNEREKKGCIKTHFSLVRE